MKDELYEKAVEIVREEGKATSLVLQKKLKVGTQRALRLIDSMEYRGVLIRVSPRKLKVAEPY